jgi:single-strand DNA-binding protein
MSGLNKVILIGRLGKDPEIVTFAESKICNTTLATSTSYTDAEGNKIERTEWHTVVFKNKQASLVEKYCKKGSHIYVEGSIRYRSYIDSNETKRYITEIVASNLQFLGNKDKDETNY